MPQSLLLVEVEVWRIAGARVSFAAFLDMFSWLFLFTVCLISTRVAAFRYSYMQLSSGFSKFHLLVASFIFSILLLIIRPNLVTLILGWDGLGVSSFFLVIFYKSNKAFNAGILTAFTNRVGDALILISFSLFLPHSSFTLPIAGSAGLSPCFILRVAVTLAAMTKRAQVPFRA